MLIDHPRGVAPMPVVLKIAILILSLLPVSTTAQSATSDAAAMHQLKQGFKLPSNVDWSDPHPCKWQTVKCDANNQVTRIQLGSQGISGCLSASVANLTNLEVLELMNNSLSFPLPSLSGLSSLQTLNLNDNQFSSIPSDFFKGLTSLQEVYLDNNPFSPWSIPDTLTDASTLKNFSANSASVAGKIPDFFNKDKFQSMIHLHLSSNYLQGSLPMGFSGFGLQSLWLNWQTDLSNFRSLNGTIEVLQDMAGLVEVRLNMNDFTGPIPDLSKLTSLKDLNLSDNQLTGPVPASLTKINSLRMVNLAYNHLQGPTPLFKDSVSVDMMARQNSFCLPLPGANCDSRVDILISVSEPFGYPYELADNWEGNDPCNNGWLGITCSNGSIILIDFRGMGLAGTISPNFAKLTSLETLILAQNQITGTIPAELADMPNLKTLDVSDNQLHGEVPKFANTSVNVQANADISSGSGKGSKTGKIVVVIGSVFALFCLVC